MVFHLNRTHKGNFTQVAMIVKVWGYFRSNLDYCLNSVFHLNRTHKGDRHALLYRYYTKQAIGVR